MSKVKVGDQAPDFILPSTKGENISLLQFRSKENVILFFYPMDESPVCSREAEAFRNSYSAFKELDAEVIGISSQSVESHKAFASHHRLPFLLLSDTDNAVRKMYGVSSALGAVLGRVTFVIDKEGIVKQVYSSQFQPARHAEEALKALKKATQKKN